MYIRNQLSVLFNRMLFIRHAAIVVLLSAGLAGAQTVQWASKVITFSTQFGTKQHSAQQALGKPNAMPQGGDLAVAWAAEGMKDDLDTTNSVFESPWSQFLKLGYATPMLARQVAIAESNAPGAVTRVTLFDEGGNAHEVYSAEPQEVRARARMLNIFFPLTSYRVAAVRVDLEPAKVPGWNEIDAVGISDRADSIRAEVTLVPHMPTGLVAQNLGPRVNTEFDDFGPVIAPDGKTLYFIRTKYPQNVGGDSAGADIYSSTLLEDGRWTYPENIGPPLNNTGYNSIESVTPDGNTVLLTNQYNADGSAGNGGLSMSHRTARGWSMPVNQTIKDYYNRSAFSESCLSADGNVILKTFEREDTYGGRDLYVCLLQPDGAWSAPLNLGPDVNTAGNEAGPFLAADGATLYFASDGRPGYGDFDLYVTRRLDSTWRHWSEPQNLGREINSDGFDAYYSVSASGDYAYFSSTRDSYGGQDIYRVPLPGVARPNPVVLVTGHVLDAKTQLPVLAHIVYEMLPSGAEAGRARSNPADGGYGITLPAGAQFGFRAEAAGYYAISDNLDTRQLERYDELKKDLFLVPVEQGQSIRLNNIFFEFAQATLKPESAPELNRVATFLKENPSVVIEIGGHSDNIGGDAVNLTMSRSRAEAVMAFLSSQGIPPQRMSAKGYGRSKPLATNDTEDGRRMNRRVEFTIVKR